MNYEAAILYAHQRMRELGKSPEQYHFEPVRISATPNEKLKGRIDISAYNEIYIIVNPQKYYGLFILSDNSSFSSDEPRDSGAPEFTGMIRLIKTGITWNLDIDSPESRPIPIPVEFLRVVIY